MKSRIERISWYAFDMGNSAHALLISTVGFALYFKEVLLKDNPNGDSAWGALTAVVLAFSAVLSPALASLASSKNKRAFVLIVTTMVCVGATALLSTWLGRNVTWAVVIYFFSALGYYLALPVYNSYLPRDFWRFSDTKNQRFRLGIGLPWRNTISFVVLGSRIFEIPTYPTAGFIP